MIRFYKKVRDFNWKYALGEIFLIFVGITLAVWFNNWNQRRIDTGKKIQYLNNLKSDLQNDIAEYREIIQANNFRMSRINRFNTWLANPINSTIHCDSVQKYLAGASFVNVFIGSSTAFDDLKSTGNLMLIEDDNLKRKIMAYYAKVDSRKHYEDLNTRFHINTIGPFLKRHWNTGALFRQGTGVSQLNNSLMQNDCAATQKVLKDIKNNAALKQELVNHINFSFFIMAMNNEVYAIMEQMATGLLQAIDQ